MLLFALTIPLQVSSGAGAAAPFRVCHGART